MNKKTNILDALEKAKGPTPQREVAKSEEGPLEKKESAPTKIIQGHFDPATHKQFAMLAIENDTNQKSLLGEAINDLFRKYGKPPIAE